MTATGTVIFAHVHQFPNNSKRRCFFIISKKTACTLSLAVHPHSLTGDSHTNTTEQPTESFLAGSCNLEKLLSYENDE